MKILHTCLNVSNIDRSIEFYTKHIGLQFISRREVKQNNAEIAFLQDKDGAAIELTYWRDKKELKEGDNFDHIAFGVSNIDATIKDLRTHGVTIAMEPFSLRAPRARSHS